MRTGKRKVGRPAKTIHGTMAARHPSGTALGWSDGQWAGDTALVGRARALVAERALLPVQGTGTHVVADDAGSPVAAYAILQALCGPESVTGDHPVHALVWLASLAIAEPDADCDWGDDTGDSDV